MKSPLVLLIPVLLALTIPACESHKAEPKPAPAAETAPTSQDDKKEEQPKLVNEFFIEGKLVNEFFIEGDSLSYKGYDVIKLKKEVYDREWCAAGRTRPCMVPVAYTAIKRNGKVLAQFDDYHYGLGNGNDVALYPLLGGESRQLIISQTGPRDGRHYVVELAEKPRVIFDSGDYEVGREEVWIQDVDNDGVYEISMLVVSFYMALNLSPSETPLPTVIFKYDPESQEYLPANHIFQTHLTQEIERLERREATDERRDMARKLGILLDYMYAGKEEEGLAFFEREYNGPDKEEIESTTVRILKKSPAYQYIRKHRTQ